MTFKKTVIQSLERFTPALALKLRAKQEMGQGEPELKLIPHLVHSDSVCFDVGANRGVYSYWFSACGAQTTAVEPHPYCVSFLKRALGKRISLIEGACSNEAGTATLRVPTVDGAANTYRSSIADGQAEDTLFEEVNVPCFPLDSKNINKLDVLKIDVEGHEESVLDGAADTIARCKPVVILEAEERHNAGVVARISKRFTSLDYTAKFIFNGAFVNLDDFDESVHQVDNEEFGARGDSYSNNFILVPNTKQELWDKIDALFS